MALPPPNGSTSCKQQAGLFSGKNAVLHQTSYGFRTGQTGQLPMGIHSQGALHKSCHLLFIFWYSSVGWVSTVPLLKAAHGPPQPGELHMSCHLLFILFLYSRTSTAPLLNAAHGPPQPAGLHICLVNFYFV